jgi:uncharacterized membrane protein YesL
MFRRLNELNFVIGLFFTIVAVILIVDALLNRALSGTINLYTGIAFLIFGFVMIIIRTAKDND